MIKASSSLRAAHGPKRTIAHHVLVAQGGSVNSIPGIYKARAIPSDSSEHASSHADDEEDEFIFDKDDETPLDNMDGCNQLSCYYSFAAGPL